LGAFGAQPSPLDITVGTAVAIGAAVVGAAVAGAAVARAGAWVAGGGAAAVAAGPQAVRTMLIAMITDKNKGILLYIVFSFYQLFSGIVFIQWLGWQIILK
jgi:hypothetical protein